MLRAALLRYGDETHAWAALEGDYEVFEHEDGVVAFVRAGGAFVTVGSPLAPTESRRSVAEAFVAFARSQSRRTSWFGAQDREALGPGFRSLRVGAQPIWCPGSFPDVLRERPALREQLRRARAKGVVVREVECVDRAELRALADNWLRTRRMAPMSFVVALHPEAEIEARRIFVAEREGCVVAVSFLVPIPGRQGMLIEDTLRTARTPNGTVELLHAEILAALDAEDCPLVSAGVVPLAQVRNVWLRRVRSLCRPLFSFEGLERFRQKLGPDRWEPVFILRTGRTPAWLSVVDALRAFADGSFCRFGWRTMRHRADLVVRLLALLLLPWMLLLALVPVEHSFPSVMIRNAWLVLDGALVIGLWILSHRWRTWLAVTLAVTAALDAVLGCAQWWAFNRHHFTGFWHAFIATTSLAAPPVAAVILWQSRFGPSTDLGARQARDDAL